MPPRELTGRDIGRYLLTLAGLVLLFVIVRWGGSGQR